jgi:dual-specificity kinase
MVIQCHTITKTSSTSTSSSSSMFTKYNEKQVFTPMYVLKKLLGSGAFGKVFEGKDQIHSRDVAIKISSVEITSKRENFIYDSIGNHSNFLQKYNFFKCKEKFWLVLEHGTSFREHIQNKDIPFDIQLFYDISNGLKYLHELGFIHTDLKIDNIVLVNGHAKIIDLGCVRMISEIPIEYPPETRDSIVPYFTTRWYRAPEIIFGSVEQITEKMDLWSLGCILFQMYTHGVTMFPCMNSEDLLSWFYLFFGSIPKETFQINQELYRAYYEMFLSRKEIDKINEYYSQDYVQFTINYIKNKNAVINVQTEIETTYENNLHPASFLQKTNVFSQFLSFDSPRVDLSLIINNSHVLSLLTNLLKYSPKERK